MVRQNGRGSQSSPFGKAFDKTLQELHRLGISENENKFSVEGEALASMFVCLVHSLHDAGYLDPGLLLENLLGAAETYLNNENPIVANHLLSMFVQMRVQLVP